MDGKKYPARLVDMPCVLETQKTLDKKTFFKSGDVGQMLIVYKVNTQAQHQRSYTIPYCDRRVVGGLRSCLGTLDYPSEECFQRVAKCNAEHHTHALLHASNIEVEQDHKTSV